MARAALGWGMRDLAQASGISMDTINRLETHGAELRASTLTAIREALERAGVEFIAEDQASESGGLGVRLAKPLRRRRSK